MQHERIICIGDVHGCLAALQTLLTLIQPSTRDWLIFLGDLIDHGPDSRGVVDEVVHLIDNGPCRVSVIQGNHEQLLVDADWHDAMYELWLLRFQGRSTLRSYGCKHPYSVTAPWRQQIPKRHWQFFKAETVESLELEQHFCVHANVHVDLPVDNQPPFKLRWETLNFVAPHESGKIMVCGHTPQKSGRVLNMGFLYNIDTYAYGGQWLTALELNTNKIWQANQQRQFQSHWLDDFPVIAGRPMPF